MTMHFDATETILVIGVGRSGLACVEALRGRGVAVYATDEKTPEHLREAIARVESQGARFVPPDQLHSVLAGVHSAVLSPGIPLTSPVVRAIADAGVPVLGEVEVRLRAPKESPRPPR
jgi:UDP-N-acetylmuramoylalanine--D-glutamate ligase